MKDRPHVAPYGGPAGGWGSVSSLLRHVAATPVASARALPRHNKPQGYQCMSCAWAKPDEPHAFEFCENGAKAAAWELTRKVAGRDFFARHDLATLRGFSDHALEDAGRLTVPLRYDRDIDRYVETGWDEALDAIAATLRATDPRSTVFYASGRAALETSYLYALFARVFGSNHLPDSSNMCHETTSVALPESIGSPVGTVLLEDFAKTDLLLFFGQNVGVSSPRMLHPLQEASRRGVPIVVFNPLRERGLERFRNPQSPADMLGSRDTRIATHYLQPTLGGDLPALTGLCKALIEADDAARAAGAGAVLDHAFIAAHTQGFAAFAAAMRAAQWPDLERRSGLTRAALEAVADVYARAPAAIALYGMGITQHRHAVPTVQMIVNLLLLRGNIGRPGAGVCPVRGHSNVQGQRTVGITEKPELVPLDKLERLYGFEAPRWEGFSTVDVCDGVLDGRVRAFLGLGGNFLRAIPDGPRLETAWPQLDLSVQVATRLNRGHLFPARETWLLPCLGRSEIDAPQGRPQAVSVEDSTACIHASRGVVEPLAPTQWAEARIVCELAARTLPKNPRLPWRRWWRDYAAVREAIEATYPEQFGHYNERLDTPGGFARPVAARERRWQTPGGRACFITPDVPDGHGIDAGEDVLKLMTLRSNDQLNTTVYGFRDRFRGLYGSRDIVLVNRDDLRRLDLAEGDRVTLSSAIDDGTPRELSGLCVVPYDIPPGCIAGYYPECNVLIPVSHHALGSKVPAAKSVPVRLRRDAAAR